MKKNRLFMALIQSLILLSVVFAQELDQSWLERYLEAIEPVDNFPDGAPQDIPLRYRDGIADSALFFARTGCTTNQFIEGLFRAATNAFTSTNWNEEEKNRISSTAVWKLTEIGHPAVTNFFKYMIDSDNDWHKGVPICAYFWRTNLEPEILSYLRTLCVQTNIYDSVAASVMNDMLETLSTMPDLMKSAATNRVAQYLYFSLHHTTQDLSFQDRMLAEFLPAYSNSIQRLETLRHIAATTTNSMTRANVQQRIDMLSAIPTNQLNDISWIAE